MRRKYEILENEASLIKMVKLQALKVNKLQEKILKISERTDNELYNVGLNDGYKRGFEACRKEMLFDLAIQACYKTDYKKVIDLLEST